MYKRVKRVDFSTVDPCLTFGQPVKPLSPSVSISVLLIGHHTFVVVLVRRICSNIKRDHP